MNVDPRFPDWHPRTWPYRLRREQWLRQQRILELSCSNQIRRLQEQLRETTHPVHRGMLEWSICTLEAMGWPSRRWAFC